MTPDELKQAIQALPPLPETAPRYSWLRHRIDLRKQILRDNPAEFLDWATIRATMFVGNAPYIEDEMNYLTDAWATGSKKWNELQYYSPQFGKSNTGVYCTNLIHQAYHLKQWEDKTGLRIEDQSRVIEFGGGYGAMALICRRLGFDGYYAIWDLPEFSLLQEFYLSNVLDFYSTITMSPPGTLWNVTNPNDLFIALYSISEIEPSDRYIPDANSYLFTYAPYGEHNNRAYFDEFMEGRPGYEWWDWENEYMKSPRYLVGVKNG